MSYTPFHPSPKKPDFILPDNACDAHCHVFGPADVFPYAPERKYTPVDAPKETLFALHDHLGFDRSVLVQASCHGTDNSAMLDMLKAGGDNYKGVAIVARDISDKELQAMHDAGVRGIRFNFVKRLVDIKPREHYTELAHRVAALGWHLIVYFEAQELEEVADYFIDLPLPLVIDHMGRPDPKGGLEHQDFQRIVGLLENRPNTWIKVGCLERLSNASPPMYQDILPFSRYLVETYPDQVLWGTDWPHPNMKSHMPDDGALVDNITNIAVSAELQQKLLVDNPARLYGF